MIIRNIAAQHRQQRCRSSDPTLLTLRTEAQVICHLNAIFSHDEFVDLFSSHQLSVDFLVLFLSTGISSDKDFLEFFERHIPKTVLSIL